MNKQTKLILGVAAVGVAGYLVFKSMKPKTTATFVSGKSKSKTGKIKLCGPGECEGPSANLCSDGCVGGVCYVPVYGERGDLTYRLAKCGGQFGSGTVAV
jgi:hypothetical protein